MKVRTLCLAVVAVASTVPPGTRSAAAQGGALTIHQAARQALEHHPRLSMARAARDDAVAAHGEARSSRIPGARAEATLMRFQEPMIVAPLHRFDITVPPQFDPTLIQSRLTLGYTLFDGGRRGARVGQARAVEESAGVGLLSAEMTVIEEVTAAYLNALTAAGVDDAASRSLVALEGERRRTQQLLSQGRAARVELLRVEAALAQGRADRISSAAELEVSLRTLARLIGEEAHLVTAARLVDVALVERPFGGDTNQTAQFGNPELQIARQQAIAERAAARAARAEWLPSVRLSAGYVTFGSADGKFSAEWQGGVAVSYPLFTGGGRRSRTARASARALRAEEKVRLVELQVNQAVDRAVAQVREGQARVTALSSAVDHLSEVTRIEQLSLSAGAGVQTDYITAEANLAAARADLVRSRNNVFRARIALARIVGKLSLEWLAEYLEDGS